MLAPGKTPLVTPSASPPVSRKASSSTLRSKLTSSSPTKRQRLSSSSRTPSVANTREGTNIEDVEQERGESFMRLMNTWAGLEERYARPIEEDDIVDLMTGRVVKDRGVLRNLDGRWDFGRFADDVQDNGGNSRTSSRAGTVAGVEEKRTNNNEDEGSDDELDSFAHLRRPSERREEPVIHDKEGDESESVVQDEEGEEDIIPFITPSTRVDALNPDNPKDAADLREFLEAEKQRRERYGSEGEDGETDEQSIMGETSSVYDELHDATRQDRSDSDEESAAQPSPVVLRESVDELAIQGEEIETPSNEHSSAAEPTHPLTALLVKNWDTTSEAASQPKPKEPVAITKSVDIRQNNVSKVRQLQTPPRSNTSGPSPFSYRGNDRESYYDYTVPTSEPSSDTGNSLPVPSSPLPPSSPFPPSSPLPPSSPPSLLFTFSRPRTSTRTLAELPSSPSPPSPSKRGRRQSSTSRSPTSKPASKTVQAVREGKTREVPIVLIQKRPSRIRAPVAARRVPESEEEEEEWERASSFPRVDLAHAVAAAKTTRKQRNLMSKPSTSFVSQPDPSSQKAKDREKAPSPVASTSSRIQSRRQSRNSSDLSSPTKETSNGGGRIAKKIRRHPESTPRTLEVDVNVEGDAPESKFVQKGKWKGKEKEKEVVTSSTPMKPTAADHNEKKRKRRNSSLSSSNEEPPHDFKLQRGSSTDLRRHRVDSGSSRSIERSGEPSRPCSLQFIPHHYPSENPHIDHEHDRSSSRRPPKQIKVEHRFFSDEDEEDATRDPRALDNKRRAQSYFDLVDHYPPHYYDPDVQPASNPLYDPRAQSILSTALHQLTALFSGGVPSWPPPPLPAMYVDVHSSAEDDKTRSRSQNPKSSSSGQHSRSRSLSRFQPQPQPHPSFYPPVHQRAQSQRPSEHRRPYSEHPHSTPQHHHRWQQDQRYASSSTSTPTHRSHPYSYSYDPSDWSKGTLPLSSSSPEPEEDENEGHGEQERQPPAHHSRSKSRQGVRSSDHDKPPPPTLPRSSSLVGRGHARGRRVSFGHVEHIGVDGDAFDGYEDRDRGYEDEREEERDSSSSSSKGRRGYRQATPGVPHPSSGQEVQENHARGSKRSKSREMTTKTVAAPPLPPPPVTDVIELTDSESDGDQKVTSSYSRGRQKTRAQTPAPEGSTNRSGRGRGGRAKR